LKNAFDAPNPVLSVHGSPPVRWNSGRLSGSTFKARDIDEKIQPYRELGIGVFFTFSNHLLEKKDLDDVTGNYMLERLVSLEGENGVIIASDLLSDYVRERFPDLRQVASVVKVTVEKGKGRPEYYAELAKRYDRFVVHPDDNFNPGLLSKLDPHKAEILVNEPCLVNCANRTTHYDLISKTGLDLQNVLNQQALDDFTCDACESIPFDRQLADGRLRRNLNMSFAEIKAVYDLGVRNFKLQGRNYGHALFLYDLTRYLLEPDYVAPLMFKVL
jgi:collagenase-like PrtC family protease